MKFPPLPPSAVDVIHDLYRVALRLAVEALRATKESVWYGRSCQEWPRNFHHFVESHNHINLSNVFRFAK